jgi:hypothetical protein
MAFIKENIPPFFDILAPEIAEFNSQDELLEIPFVKRFRIDHEGNDDIFFYRYSLFDTNKLLVEICNGKSNFVVGFLSGNYTFLHLPKWVPYEETTKKCQDSVDIPQ